MTKPSAKGEIMGTQQILLLVIGMIMVGIMISVGIAMFINHEYNSNKNAMASEMATYPPYVIRYWLTIKMLGGAEKDAAMLTKEKIAGYLGFMGANYSNTSENGEFRISSITGTTVVLKGLGKETRLGKHPLVTATVNLATETFTTTVSVADSL